MNKFSIAFLKEYKNIERLFPKSGTAFFNNCILG